MKNNYNIEKIIDALYKKGSTNFLNQKDLNLIKGKLNKNEYKIYNLYKDSNKVILYKKNIPSIKLLKIVSKAELKHQDILGTIFSLGVKEDTFGDIIKYQGSFYIFTLPHLAEYFIYNLNEIKGNYITLTEIELKISENFIQEYIEKEYIVSSLRLDNIISTIIGESRSVTLERFKNKEIILNYNSEIKPNKILKLNDIFSIRKIGKFKFKEIKKTTKKGGFVIKILKYK